MGEPNASSLWVICLCAEWCTVCREWRETFDAEARNHPNARFAWVDVEDEDEAMGDVDIQTFPTLLIARGETPLFLGPIQPSAAQLKRLIERLMHQGTDEAHAPAPVSAEAASLLRRLLVSVLPKA